jgi:hypothetical protein
MRADSGKSSRPGTFETRSGKTLRMLCVEDSHARNGHYEFQEFEDFCCSKQCGPFGGGLAGRS